MPKLLLAAGAVALVLTMTGCGEPPPHVTPTPTPSAAPVFASDEEALAAAEESYAAYLAVSDEIFAEGGADSNRLAAVASGDFLEQSLAGFETVARNGWRSTGLSTFDSFELQSYDPSTRTDAVKVYVCDDVSAIDVLDADGVSVVSPDRPDRTLFEVSFDLNLSDTLLVSGQEVWGSGKC